jgi:hypothetical protein
LAPGDKLNGITFNATVPFARDDSVAFSNERTFFAGTNGAPDAFEQPFHSLDGVICKLDARTPELKVELTPKRRDKATLGRAHRSRSTVINVRLRSQGRRNQPKRDRRQAREPRLLRPAAMS